MLRDGIGEVYVVLPGFLEHFPSFALLFFSFLPACYFSTEKKKGVQYFIYALQLQFLS